MALKTQKRLAAELLDVGSNRVWIDPDRIEKVESAITRNEVRRLIHEGAIKALRKQGVSRSRAKLLHEKKASGRRKGIGSRKGARYHQKEVWVNGIRNIRSRLKELRDKRMLTKPTHRKLFMMAKGGAFRSISHLNEYLGTHKLLRRR